MTDRFPPIHPRWPGMLHGADYNPEQWLHDPGVLDDDVRLMKTAGCNVMSVGIFAWSSLEPEEGRYEFDWLDRTMDRLGAAGIGVMLATPSGARPTWMTLGYPEVRRENDWRRVSVGRRHDHCPTSPVCREHSVRINEKLAERYGSHPALLAWHVSNEYGGECYCNLCLAAFRQWARRRFHDDIEALNDAWWTTFWSRRITDFEQIDNPAIRPVDWRRFTTDRMIDFFLAEAEPLRRLTPNIPITTNFMGVYPGLDYMRFAEHLDFVSWDSYPRWHQPEVGDIRIASETAFVHDLYRRLKGGRPFVLMESQPQLAKGMGVKPLKRPGLHLVSSLQAIAHGSDSVQYFQWRKSRGGEEKFHGAVVDHVGHENTRGFREVADVGRMLSRLGDVVGTTTPAKVAVLYDWPTRWALEHDNYLQGGMKQYAPTVMEHHFPFWSRGISIDVIGMDDDLSGYQLVIAPLMYMIRDDIDVRLAAYVEQGGCLVTTYGCGLVDEHDRAITGGWPGGKLRALLGVWHEETDGLYPNVTVPIAFAADNPLHLVGPATAWDVCDIVHAESARVVATYDGQFYVGMPALTVNRFGRGKAYHLAARFDPTFLQAFYDAVADDLRIRPVLDADLDEGVTVTCRTDGRTDHLFVMNFADQPRSVALREPVTDHLTGAPCTGTMVLPGMSVRVMRRPYRE